MGLTKYCISQINKSYECSFKKCAMQAPKIEKQLKVLLDCKVTEKNYNQHKVNLTVH